jgi:integration host factor subunit beta
MIKSELVARIRAQNPDLYQHQAEKIVNAILDEISLAIAWGDRVELRGFGAFTCRVRSPRVGRNPKTGMDVPVPKKVVPYFKPGKEIRERLNSTPASGDV